jgi:hypothetical protein
MADLDTKLKRSSGINPSSPWRSQLPYPPTGTVSQAARQAVAYLYSGILASNPTPPTFKAIWASQRSGMIGAR